MGSEVLLYGYGAVCISMLVFNIIYNILMKRKVWRLEKRSKRFADEMERQLERVRTGEEMSPGYMKHLQRRLSHVNNLIAFDRVMDEHLSAEEDEAVSEYHRQIQPVILYLTVLYKDRDNMQAAYFAYFLSRHKLKKHMSVDAVQDILVEYMKKDSLYCRVNAMQALYDFGSAVNVAEAVVLLDRNGGFFHEKILTDGLLSFTGSHEKLMELLWGRFERFSDKTKLAVLNYIRFRSGDYCERIFRIMCEQDENKELRLSAIRYFGRYYYEPAKEPLLAFASDKDTVNWEYAAISITSLASYQGSDVLHVLMGAMHSSNWYIRKNAAASLEKHQLDYTDLSEVAGSNDRYAREMMLYQLDSRKHEEITKEIAV